MDGSPFINFVEALGRSVQVPLIWLKKSVIEPNQKDYPWYHQQYRRVPTIDQCYTDDVTCIFEANEQFRRDKYVDDQILAILRRRKENCYQYEGHDRKGACAQLREDYEQAAADWFCKYGDLGMYRDVRKAYMKQKHRQIWERRHGPVGSGMSTVAAE